MTASLVLGCIAATILVTLVRRTTIRLERRGSISLGASIAWNALALGAVVPLLVVFGLRLELTFVLAYSGLFVLGFLGGYAVLRRMRPPAGGAGPRTHG